jgi:RNA polymerase sigma-32 factor
MKNFSEADRSIEQYVAEITHYPVLSRQAEVELATEYQRTRTEAAAHRLVVSNLRFVVKVAHEYRGYNLKLLDLIQEGNIGLMMAVGKFDPSKGYRLISYAVWWIRAYIQNYVMRSWSLVKLGTTQAQRKLFFKLRSERERAERQLGIHTPVAAEAMAERLGVKEQDIVDMDQRLGTGDLSLDVELHPDSHQSHLDSLANPETLPDQEELCAAAQQRQIMRRKVQQQLGLLNEKERYIIEKRLMCEEPHTLHQIGNHFQISRERARQIEGNVLRKMRESLRGSGLEPMSLAS